MHAYVCRYNISTADYNAWDPSVNGALERVQQEVFNGDNVARTTISPLNVWSRFGLSQDEAYQVSADLRLVCDAHPTT